MDECSTKQLLADLTQTCAQMRSLKEEQRTIWHEVRKLANDKHGREEQEIGSCSTRTHGSSWWWCKFAWWHDRRFGVTKAVISSIPSIGNGKILMESCTAYRIVDYSSFVFWQTCRDEWRMSKLQATARIPKTSMPRLLPVYIQVPKVAYRKCMHARGQYMQPGG